MSQIEKLFEKLGRKPTPTDVLFDDVDRLLRAYNFKSRHPSGGGSHYTYTHPDLPDIVTVAKHGNKIKAAYVRAAVKAIEKVLDLHGGKEK
ncbi:MAG: type II toxin-antitoxin system HicA family toxin [Candidatus Delongbacteria bacterium]|nr:type II toxin-antitoxin system HicA family toxin [Candidatus Delongbacteria bacterium]